MRADRNGLLKFAGAGFAHHDVARRFGEIGRRLRHHGIEIARGPGGDDVGDIGRVAPVAQQMIGAGERHKTLGMLGRDEDAGGVVDADGIVGRRVQHQQRLMEAGDIRHQAVLGDIVEELAGDMERPAGERDLDLAVRADVLDAVLEQAGDMGGIGGGGDSDDGSGVRNFSCGGEDRGAAEAVADQDRRRFSGFAQMIGGVNQVGDVGGEGGVGKIAFAGAEPGEIEPQHRDAPGRQRRCDAPRGQHILAAGEAMREQRVGERLTLRQVERCGQLMAAFTGELETFSRHGRPPFLRLCRELK